MPTGDLHRRQLHFVTARPECPELIAHVHRQAQIELELNFRGQLTAEVTPIPAIGGTWTAWLDPDVVGPGIVTTTLWVRGANLNLAALPGGCTNVHVATVAIFVVPAI